MGKTNQCKTKGEKLTTCNSIPSSSCPARTSTGASMSQGSGSSPPPPEGGPGEGEAPLPPPGGAPPLPASLLGPGAPLAAALGELVAGAGEEEADMGRLQVM